MYAYSMAAAHERLPHFQVRQHMVSNVESDDEGWPWVDTLPNVCDPPVNDIFFPDKNLPTFVHFCQNYMVGNTGFAKRRVPENIFSCDSPLFVDLPNNLDKMPDPYRFKRQKVEYKHPLYLYSVLTIMNFYNHICIIESVGESKTVEKRLIYVVCHSSNIKCSSYRLQTSNVL
jgi:hypothetical protein